MHILLPPSETKADIGSSAELTDRTAPVDVGALSVRGLTAARRAVLAAPIAVSNRVDSGLDVLGLGPGQRDGLARNIALRRAPAHPAAEIYTGVLYASLDVPTLPPAASAELDRSVLVFSGLWGVVRLTDLIRRTAAPSASRCPASAVWPRTGEGVGPTDARRRGR